MSEEKDINKVFEDLLFAEEKFIEEAYKEGLEENKIKDNIEGFHLGYHRGAEIGAELGFYYTVTNLYLEKSSISEKTKIVLSTLKLQIEKFPRNNVDDVDIVDLLTKIQLLYKKACALLKITLSYPEKDNLSF